MRMRRRLPPACAALLCGALATGPGAAIAAEKAAVFPIEMHDPGAAYGSRLRPVDAKKLALVTDELKTSLKNQAGLDIVDTAPAAKEVEQQGRSTSATAARGTSPRASAPTWW